MPKAGSHPATRRAPASPDKRYLDWTVDTPESKTVDDGHLIRDDLGVPAPH